MQRFNIGYPAFNIMARDAIGAGFSTAAPDRPVSMGSGPGWKVVGRDKLDRDFAADWVQLTAEALLTAPVGAATATILAALGPAAEADRAWMIEYNDDLTLFHNTHEWCRPGVISHVENLQHMPIAIITWMHKDFLRERAVMMIDIDRLPKSARALQVECQRQSNKSALCVPILVDGRLRAYFGFDAVLHNRRWGSEVVAALFRCGDLIGRARFGNAPQKAEEATEKRPAASFQPLLYFRTRKGMRGIAATSIIGLRSERDYCRVYLADGTVILDLRSLKYWEALLPRTQFTRMHRCAIVNISRVTGLKQRSAGYWQAELAGIAEPWNVSRAGMVELRSRLGF